MTKQLIFLLSLIITFGVFAYTVRLYAIRFRITKAGFPVRQIGKRILLMLRVAFGQTRIFRKPVLGLLHALVFWGFCVILIGSIEMVIDGLAGTERILRVLGPLYNFIIASGDVFALIITIAILVFLIRRVSRSVKRFHGIEMLRNSHIDANISLLLILILMISLLGMNTFYLAATAREGKEVYGFFPVSGFLSSWISPPSIQANARMHEINWWTHILVIFFFANYLPYSKHFHVFLSVPNVFLSRLELLGKLTTMENVTREVRIMMDPNQAFAAPPAGQEGAAVSRFGVLDVEDITWKNYFDALSCTECGRCTASCPAHITGKKLSPRKIMMDVRARMKEKVSGLLLEKAGQPGNRTLLRDFTTEEELWACTLCNACARECPVNINHPDLIVNMRRYLVMEQSAAPGELNAIFSNIENNGAPWQFSRQDRLLWAAGLDVPVMADLAAKGEKPEYLLWVGSAGAFDDRYKQVSRAFVKILNSLKISYAVLGTEESSSGDVARRAGNEILFQMQALMNIELLHSYGVTRILTCDPHAYNTFKNEYPDLGGHYEVIHHSQFLGKMIDSGNMQIPAGSRLTQKVTFHDPCYLGRANNEYRAPRKVLGAVAADITEMGRSKSFALCCGAGGGQMFKEAEKGEKEIFIERTEEALGTGAEIIATACPYCMVMMTDGLKYKNREDKIKNYDIGEMVASALGLL